MGPVSVVQPSERSHCQRFHPEGNVLYSRTFLMLYDLNPPAVTELLNSKPYQLHSRKKLGLPVPKATITNNPEAVKNIIRWSGKLACYFQKSNPLFMPRDKLLYTTEITREFPSHSNNSIAQCPAIFQVLVARRSDLRESLLLGMWGVCSSYCLADPKEG